jgi:hypothetical protein
MTGMNGIVDLLCDDTGEPLQDMALNAAVKGFADNYMMKDRGQQLSKSQWKDLRPKDRTECESLYSAGCPYYLGGGQCVRFGYTKGCAKDFQTWLIARVVPSLESIEGLIGLNFIGIFVSCCLSLTRKTHDVLPTKYVLQEAAAFRKQNGK